MTKPMTLRFRKATWHEHYQGEKDLEKLLRNNLVNVNKNKLFDIGKHSVLLHDYKVESTKYVIFDLWTYIIGQEAAAIGLEEDNFNEMLLLQAEKSEYMVSNASVLVSGNDVYICSQSWGDYGVISFIREALKDKVKIDKRDLKLKKKANEDINEAIKNGEIKYIDYQALASELPDAKSKASNFIGNYLGAYIDLPSSNIKTTFRLSISDSKGDDSDYEDMRDIVNDFDTNQIKIKLKDGREFQGENIIVSKKVQIEESGNTFLNISAHSALKAFYDERQ